MATAPELFADIPEVLIRPMAEVDVASVVAIERASYQFPWSEGIFRDCLRVGYVCRVVTVEEQVIGYGVMSVGAGEAHILNLCVGEAFRCRGVGKRLLQSLGFEQVGMRRGYYQAVGGREDAAVLKLALRGRRTRPN
jgi:ribosomal-protein-alanine N-acetyltransferase